MPTVTVGFSARERFSTGAMCLKSIFDNTEIPFNLILVDCNMPQRYRDEMMAVIGDRKNVTIIKVERFLLPNQSKNLILQASRDADYVCLTDMDTSCYPGWLSRMVQACEETGADVAVPLIEETTGEVHFDPRLGKWEMRQTEAGPKLEILPRVDDLEDDRHADRRPIELIENHCVLYRRGVIDRMGPLDGELTTRIEVDLSLQLRHADARCIFEPKSVVTFWPPPPVQPDEREFFLFKWDSSRAERSHDRIFERWNLYNLPNSMKLVDRRLSVMEPLDPDAQVEREKNWTAAENSYVQTARQAVREICQHVPETDKMILADNEEWRTFLFAGREILPFTERNGQYWGPPADDASAIAEVERQRTHGAKYLAVGFPALSWLSHYKGFERHMRSHFPCLMENERGIVFDLRG